MIIDRINDILNSQVESSSLSSFCYFLKANIEIVPQLTLQEIANQCHISKGQVSKCIKMLDFSNYEEFHQACLQQIDSLSRHKKFIDVKQSGKDNILQFSNTLVQEIEYVSKNISYKKLKELILALQKATHVYLYARGDVRGSCYTLLRELNIKHVPCSLCDSDFKKNYSFKKDDLLLIISTNGNLFTYDPRIVKRLDEAKAYKYLLTCSVQKRFDETLFIETNNPLYNEYAMRHVLDLIMLLL